LRASKNQEYHSWIKLDLLSRRYHRLLARMECQQECRATYKENHITESQSWHQCSESRSLCEQISKEADRKDSDNHPWWREVLWVRTMNHVDWSINTNSNKLDYLNQNQ
jgi:hypothetical protein